MVGHLKLCLQSLFFNVYDGKRTFEENFIIVSSHIYIYTIKTTFDINSHFYQAFTQHELNTHKHDTKEKLSILFKYF